MIESIEFKNFKVLRNCTLPLGRCNILIGPNGSGKTTVLQALEAVRKGRGKLSVSQIVSVGVHPVPEASVEVTLTWGDPLAGVGSWNRWRESSRCEREFAFPDGMPNTQRVQADLEKVLNGIRVFAFDASAIAAPAPVTGGLTLEGNGSRLAAVLDGLRDEVPERFEAINVALGHWLPEFDRVEEPDRGIHPRLLRRVQDAIYRLSHPESCGEEREPVQVIATTHSPYFVDLFKDHPEEIIICERVGQEVQFKRVSDLPNMDEILSSAPLGEIWYSGILGGVPTKS
jgi:energy-coupling factor transporter ATP-binding protein EcfA2